MKKKILMGFGLPLVIFLGGSIIAALYITKTTQRMDKLIMLHQVEILREDLIIHVQYVQSHIYRNRIRNRGDVDALIAQVQEMDHLMDSCMGCHHSPELTQGLLGMRDMANDYKAAISRLVTASANSLQIASLEHRAQDLGQDLIAMTQGMAFTANVRLQQKTQETMATIREVRNVLYITLALGFFLAVITALFLAKSLDRQLQKLFEATRRISQGALQHRVNINDARGGEFKELGEAFNTMTQSLQVSQRQMVQSAKLAAIGELATNIAYEVNNPLTGILGDVSLLLKADDVPADKKERLKTIERDAIRARAILRNLLDFSRRKPSRPVKTEISGLVQDTIFLVNEQAKMSNVEIVSSCFDGLPQVALDIDEMKQVFVNLINNAFFAMSKGGVLTIRCMRGRDISDKEVVTVEFTDTGQGIPEEHLDKIFDPFFTMRPDGEGTGLGLSISYMIVQNHGGRIEVDSKIGEGSTFRVILPVQE
ncbi:MAG: sensor histidine kinase [Betaproteobacteria bacterium]